MTDTGKEIIRQKVLKIKTFLERNFLKNIKKTIFGGENKSLFEKVKKILSFSWL